MGNVNVLSDQSKRSPQPDLVGVVRWADDHQLGARRDPDPWDDRRSGRAVRRADQGARPGADADRGVPGGGIKTPKDQKGRPRGRPGRGGKSGSGYDRYGEWSLPLLSTLSMG